MSEINSFIISFCISSILLGFLYMLCPSGSMGACVKYVFCLCFACSVMASVIGVPKPDFLIFDKQQGYEILTEQNVAVTAQSVFCEALRQENINFRKITVDTNKLEDDSITISKITVYTSEPTEKILAILNSDSYEVVVINE